MSVEAAAGVKWRGDYHLLAPGEMAAFVAQLTALGYNPKAFRVTVRRATEAPEGVLRYTVFVVQIWKRVPYRGKRYIGGHGADWVSEFSRSASTNFPRSVDPWHG